MAIFADWPWAIAAAAANVSRIPGLFVSAVLPRHSGDTAERYATQAIASGVPVMETAL